MIALNKSNGDRTASLVYWTHAFGREPLFFALEVHIRMSNIEFTGHVQQYIRTEAVLFDRQFTQRRNIDDLRR